MIIKRIFICHTIRSKDLQNIQILRYVLDILHRTGIQFIINKNDGSEDSFFQQLSQELPNCQALLLLQTADTIYARRVQMALRNAKILVEQKKMQNIFRFVCPPSANTTIPQDWQGLTTFDGTRDYQRACRELVLSLLERTPKSRRTTQALTTRAPSISPRISLPQKPAQTNFANSINRKKLLEAEPTAAIPVLPSTSLPQTPAPLNYHPSWTTRLKAMLEKFHRKLTVLKDGVNSS
jgi:hypothetical protein